jgi:putative transposase
MPRSTREVPGHVVYHVLNRAVARLAIFETDDDYAAFVKVFRQAAERQDALVAKGKARAIEVLGWCLMPNHWHLVLLPHGDGELSDFMRWLQMTHTQRWHAHRRSAGTGPLYQGRFKSFPVDEEGGDGHLPEVLAYVERNAKKAGLVEKAGDWPWGSLARRGKKTFDEPGPPVVPIEELPGGHAYDLARWRRKVERRPSEATAEAIATSIRRGRPYGRDAWTTRIAGRLNLQSTLRPRGRPRRDSGSQQADEREKRRAVGSGETLKPRSSTDWGRRVATR